MERKKEPKTFHVIIPTMKPMHADATAVTVGGGKGGFLSLTLSWKDFLHLRRWGVLPLLQFDCLCSLFLGASVATAAIRVGSLHTSTLLFIIRQLLSFVSVLIPRDFTRLSK